MTREATVAPLVAAALDKARIASTVPDRMAEVTARLERRRDAAGRCRAAAQARDWAAMEVAADALSTIADDLEALRARATQVDGRLDAALERDEDIRPEVDRVIGLVAISPALRTLQDDMADLAPKLTAAMRDDDDVAAMDALITDAGTRLADVGRLDAEDAAQARSSQALRSFGAVRDAIESARAMIPATKRGCDARGALIAAYAGLKAAVETHGDD